MPAQWIDGGAAQLPVELRTTSGCGDLHTATTYMSSVGQAVVNWPAWFSQRDANILNENLSN